MDGVTCPDSARVNPEQGQFAFFLKLNFKNKGDGGGFRIRFDKDIFFVFHSCGGGDVKRRGEVAAYGVKQRLDACIAQSRSGQNGTCPARKRGPPQGVMNILFREIAVKIALHERIIDVRQAFQQKIAPGKGQGIFFFCQFPCFHADALIFLTEFEHTQRNQIDDALK